MKFKFFLFVFLILGVTAVWAAEDLGELAKKEKARREALGKEGKKPKVFTNDDIDKLKAQIAIQSGTAATDDESAAAEEQQSETESESSESEASESSEAASETEYSSESSSETRSQQEQQVSNQELQDLKDQREQAQRELDEAKKTIGDGGLLHTRNVGDQFDRIREAQRKLEEINNRIREIEKSNK